MATGSQSTQPGPGFQINAVSGGELLATGTVPCFGLVLNHASPLGPQPTAPGLHTLSRHGAVKAWPHGICLTTSKCCIESSVSANQQATDSIKYSHTHFLKMLTF